MSPAFIKGVPGICLVARITFDKVHVVAHASTAGRLEQKTATDLKRLRWALLKGREALPENRRANLDALIAQATANRAARA